MIGAAGPRVGWETVTEPPFGTKGAAVQSTVTIHVADVPVRTALSMLVRSPLADGTAGLVHADVASAAPLRGRLPVPAAQPRRIGLIGFWRSRDAADRWAEANADAPIMGGVRAVLEPLRAHGDWPGLPADISRTRTTAHDGPSVVLTLGRVRASQFLRFLRTSRPAERDAVSAPGMLWGTALARPPFVATCSLWDSTVALSTYAYGDGQESHPSAITADREKGFHHQSAFVRFRAVSIEGTLAGRNRLDASVLAAMVSGTTGGAGNSA